MPDEGIIVIDEPEMHVHRALQAPLGDAIEALRPDCLFVYITHDIDFALTRVNAPKVCVTSHDGSNWDWYVISPSDGRPEDILLQIVGGRRPVLFVEGEQSSLDLFLFRHLYPSYTIVPHGGCEQVINATCTFTSLKEFHRLKCAGIVDLDYRTPDQVIYLQNLNVYPLAVAEIENLYLLDNVLQHIANHLGKSDFDTTMDSIRAYVFCEFEKERERIASDITTRAIESQFKQFDAKVQSKLQIEMSFKKLIDAINIGEIYDAAIKRIDTILSNRDYNEAIRLYTNKGLIYHASTKFGLTSDGLRSLIHNLIRTGQGENILDAIRVHIPALP